MAGGGVVVSAAYFLLQLIHFSGKEFDRAAALGANHVVMAAPVVLVLVTGNAVVEGYFAGEPGFGQQLESPIDGGVADAGIFLLDKAVQFVGGEVVAGLEESAQYCVALGRLLEAYTLEVTVEDILGFAHHLARDGRLIIDALLQHEGSG